MEACEAAFESIKQNANCVFDSTELRLLNQEYYDRFALSSYLLSKLTSVLRENIINDFVRLLLVVPCTTPSLYNSGDPLTR